MNVAERLREALPDVGPVLERSGFMRDVRTGFGSGGPYAVAEYRRGLWRAYLCYREGLEPGWYRHGWIELSHSALLPAQLRSGLAVTPGECAKQIETHGELVLRGDWREFWRRARRAQRNAR